MATNTYKNGINRLSNRRISKEQRARINASRDIFVNFFNDNGNQESPDTLERRQIHSRIMKLVEEGKCKEEIISILIKEFPESKLRNFFDSYAQHHINKINNKSSGEAR